MPMEMSYPATDDPLLLILKLPGETCNINCYYCFEKRKPYPSAQTIEPPTLRRALQSLGNRSLDVQLHGGEPLLLGRERIRALLAELRAYPGRLQLYLQTNGTTLTEEWFDFFDAEWPEIEIGISLDGDAAANAHRVDYRDRPTHAQVEHALGIAAARDRKVGLIAVATRQSLGRAREILSYFASLPAVRNVNFSPCLDYSVKTKEFPRGNRKSLMVLNPDGQGMPGWATTPLEYADFLIDLFNAWRDTGAYQRFIVEPLFSLLRTIQGQSTRFCHFSEKKCAHVLTLYPDGRIGSCDELRMPDALLTHVSMLGERADIAALQHNSALRPGMDALLERCSKCDYQTTCRGGCLATRLSYQGTAYEEEYCHYRIRVIDYLAAAIGAPPIGHESATAVAVAAFPPAEISH